MTTNIDSALQSVKKHIATAATNVGRQPEEIMLLAASKTNPAEQVRKAWLAGQTVFGENYLQEALEKILVSHQFHLHHLTFLQMYHHLLISKL